jgi:hypothetical protein
LSEARIRELKSASQLDPASDAYAMDVGRRADQIVMLAAMDDGKAATQLGPLLLARSTQDGLGRPVSGNAP